MSNQRKSVLIVDDHPLMREALAARIAQEPDLEVFGQAQDASEALTLVAERIPDMAIVDIFLKGASGLELTSTMTRKHPGLAVLVISMHKEEVYAERAINAGARGYITKEKAGTDVLTAIRTILSGETYLSDHVRESMREGERRHKDRRGGRQSLTNVLSDRELEVLQLLGQGKGTREAARILNLSPKTVDSHVTNIKSKMDFKDGNELVEYAVLWVNGPR